MSKKYLKGAMELQTTHVHKKNMSHLQLIWFLNKEVGHDMTRLIMDYDWANTTKILINNQVSYLIQEHKYLLFSPGVWRRPPNDFHLYILEKNYDKLCTNKYVGKGAGRHGSDPDRQYHDYLLHRPRPPM